MTRLLVAWGGGELELAGRAYERSARVHEELLSRATGSPTAWVDGLATAYEALAEVRRATGDVPGAVGARAPRLARRIARIVEV